MPAPTSLQGQDDGTSKKQRVVELALAAVAPLADKLTLVLAQPELESRGLQEVGFASIKTLAALSTPPQIQEVVLIASFGREASAAQRVVSALSKLKVSPTVIVVMVVPLEDGGQKLGSMAQVYFDQGCRLSQARATLFAAGSDDVICLLANETLTPHRVMESIQKSEFMANRMSEIINHEVGAVEEKAARKLQQAHRRFLMLLPGRVLESIPCEDESLQEQRADNGSLVGIGDCTFSTKLGSGAFGHVFKASHPQHGACAVKIITKRSIKNANILFSLERGLCLMLYSDPHPNIVRAHEVMHGAHNFYVVMDYAGQLDLQKYTKMMVDHSENLTLPLETIKSFSLQESSAVAHLHSFMVCHRDIKPDNWIVSDDGSNLKLADFGLAMQLSGPSHPLQQSCGSLPFCAPEVFDCESSELSCSGYNGLAADVWSLGVNFMELVCGPYSIEQLLGWLPQHPAEHDQILAGLRSLEVQWSRVASLDESGLSPIISGMIVLQPSKRWKMGQVLGIQCGDSAAALKRPRETRRSTISLSRRRASEVVISDNKTLCSRLGGLGLVLQAIHRMFDHFLWTPGFGDVFDSSPKQAQAVRQLYCDELPEILDAYPGSARDEEVRTKVRRAHEGLYFVDKHVSVMLEHLKSALKEVGLDDPVVAEAVAKFERFKPDVTGCCKVAVARARSQNSATWRAQVLANTPAQLLTGFAKILPRRISESPVLSKTALTQRTPAVIHSHLLAYLRSVGGTTNGPVWFPEPGGEATLGSIEHMVYLNVVRDSFVTAGWALDVAEAFYFSILQDCSGD